MSQRGFTLLEVLLAFALLAGASVLLLSMLSTGLRDVSDAERHGEAALHARSLIDNLGRVERLRPGSRSGEFDGGRYRWTLSVTRVPDPVPALWPDPAQPAGAGGAALPPGADTGGIIDAAEPLLFRLDLEITWGAGGPRQTFRTATLRALYPLPEDL
ncbi:MAG TPA: general secretion pathway protein GspI [Xanthomonadaceae bacterium]|jgi:general secretion pathway protein I|nr:general secretion pathway protein GspI [Xanthomonadaceae bacterium]